MLATLSPEAKINDGLRQLNCAAFRFAEISASINKSRLSNALAGKVRLERDEAENLLEVLSEMQQLQAAIDVPIDWSRTDRIILALVSRRIARIEKELQLEPSPIIQSAVDKSTQSVK